MKKIVIRNCSASLLAANIVVSSIAIILGTLGICLILTGDESVLATPFRNLTAIIIGLFVCIPCLLVIVNCFLAYLETIEISKSEVMFYRFGAQKCQIALPQITVFGCAEFIHRNGYIFFVSTPRDDIIDFARMHQHDTSRLFGKNRTQNLRTSEEGCWQLAVGTYVQMCRWTDGSNIIVIKNASPRLLKTISDYLQKKPILTGPIALDQLEMWIT